jgi:two-component system phosphate regulon sensor histidine kinase PhoR
MWQIYPPVLVITLLSVVAVAIVAVEAMKDLYEQEAAQDLLIRAALLEEPVSDFLARGAMDDLNRETQRLAMKTETRLTVILPSGVVVADSEEDPANMANHGSRPEIQAVLQWGQPGTSQRTSATLSSRMIYAAVPVMAGEELAGVLRVAVPLTSVQDKVRALYGQLAAGVVFATILVALLSLLVARRVGQPLDDLKRGAQRFARGDLEHKLTVPETREMGAVAEAMNDMAEQLNERIQTVSQQRNELEAVLSSMEEGVLAVDRNERLISINGAAAAMLKIDAFRGQGRLIQEEVRNTELQRFVQRALSSHLPVSAELELHDETSVHNVHAHGTVLQDAEGGIIGALIVLHDVSQLRQLEQIRRDFVANVSHELRTPVTSVKGFVETLLDSDLQDEEQVRRFLTIIASQADRLQAIIEDLLSLSRLEQESDHPLVPFEMQDVRAVLASAIETCQTQAREKGIGIELQCEELLNGRVNGQLLEQAVVNLVDNAIKYSSPDTRVVVEGSREGNEVVIAVRDQGCGIERKHLTRIFERFYRVDRARSRKLGGTGLGLSIVKHIVQVHGGYVHVESQPGIGSTFTIHLPQD